ncbi:hypothetical protein VMCG_10082 [Cytospora schulzeri]|uniref:Uncharacterized protein n=1 Tax=Cytospora schulzeri TaxID=448051 RepID=A0A423VCX5_9PEZI|nr:hypothetical protein VMCG_10082 [Valsa malicola]
MQVDGTTQQQRKGRKNSPPKRQKAIMEEKHVQFGGILEGGNLAPDGKRVGTKQGRPKAAKNFFEGYTDSPEFSRFSNPVVQKTQDGDDDDEDYIAPPKFANYQSPMDRRKADPFELRRLASFGAHLQARAQLGGECFNGARLPTQSAVAASLAPVVEDDEYVMDEDDDEEPEDDTFEFLLK